MPLIINEELPAYDVLRKEHVFVVNLIADKSGRRIFLTGHFEYDADSLAKEFYRDLDKGLPIQLPYGYFPEDDPKQAPLMRWKAHANLFYSNWLNYFVYQETPYHINDIQA